LAQENMGKLVDLCRAHNITVGIGVYPWPSQIVARDLPSRHEVAWREFAQQRGLMFTDHFPDFIGHGPPLDFLETNFIVNDIHWNEQGHKLVVERWMQQRCPPGAQDRLCQARVRK
jgi:hypothetical protein